MYVCDMYVCVSAVRLISGMNEYPSWAPTVRKLLGKPAMGAAPSDDASCTPFVVTAWTAAEALAVRGIMLDAGTYLATVALYNS
jgi:hypothetical protein